MQENYGMFFEKTIAQIRQCQAWMRLKPVDEDTPKQLSQLIGRQWWGYQTPPGSVRIDDGDSMVT